MHSPTVMSLSCPLLQPVHPNRCRPAAFSAATFGSSSSGHRKDQLHHLTQPWSCSSGYAARCRHMCHAALPAIMEQKACTHPILVPDSSSTLSQHAQLWGNRMTDSVLDQDKHITEVLAEQLAEQRIPLSFSSHHVSLSEMGGGQPVQHPANLSLSLAPLIAQTCLQQPCGTPMPSQPASSIQDVPFSPGRNLSQQSDPDSILQEAASAGEQAQTQHHAVQACTRLVSHSAVRKWARLTLVESYASKQTASQQAADMLSVTSSRGHTWLGLTLQHAFLTQDQLSRDSEASVQDAAGGGGLLHGGPEDGGEGGGPSRGWSGAAGEDGDAEDDEDDDEDDDDDNPDDSSSDGSCSEADADLEGFDRTRPSSFNVVNPSMTGGPGAAVRRHDYQTVMEVVHVEAHVLTSVNASTAGGSSFSAARANSVRVKSLPLYVVHGRTPYSTVGALQTRTLVLCQAPRKHFGHHVQRNSSHRRQHVFSSHTWAKLPEFVVRTFINIVGSSL